MSTSAVTPDQFQYIKLPDGSYGKFRSDASDEQIKGAISKDFPTAFKPSVATAVAQRPGVPRPSLAMHPSFLLGNPGCGVLHARW